MYDTKQMKMRSITGFSFMNIFANAYIFVHIQKKKSKLYTLTEVSHLFKKKKDSVDNMDARCNSAIDGSGHPKSR